VDTAPHLSVGISTWFVAQTRPAALPGFFEGRYTVKSSLSFRSAVLRQRLAFGHRITRILCAITGLSLSIGIGGQALIENRGNLLFVMVATGMSSLAILLFDYRSLDSLVGE
jgi:hypothetical protein